MVKRVSMFLLAGLLAAPMAVQAAPTNEELAVKVSALEAQLADMDDNSESWDLSSRFQWSGDFRTKADYVTADAPAHYSALNVARGVNSFTRAYDSMTTIGAGFATIGDMLTGLAPIMTDLATWKTNIAGMGITAADQQEALFYMFTNSEVGAMLASMAALPTTAVTEAMKTTQSLSGFMKNLSPAARKNIFDNMGYTPPAGTKYNNDTIYTNRLRLNMRVKATENMEFKGRLAMYKVWGMQNNAVDYTYNNGMGGGAFMLNSLAFDGSATRQPTDSILRVDRAFINWNDIADLPIWFSIGRRPTTDGSPNQLRLGADKKMATPTAVMDYPFDGLSLGYAYDNLFGIPGAPGRVRLCYGRGFESGPTDNGNGLNDVDFGGLSWDIYHKGDRFLTFQSFAALNMFNVPDDVTFVNPVEFATWENDSTQYNPLDPSKDLKLGRTNLGNIYHTSSVYMSKINNLHYFVLGGWSRTDAKGYDELGTSLLGSWWDTPEDKDGYAGYVGVRYDLGDTWRFGAEYNYGSKNWIAFTPGNDDLYASKLATRGSVYELYTIWNIPTGDAVSKFGKTFIRLGYQHYDYEYTGSGFWLGEPVKIDDLANDPLNAQFYVPVDTMDQVYLSIEAWF